MASLMASLRSATGNQAAAAASPNELSVNLSSFPSPPYGDAAETPKTDILISINAPTAGTRPPTDVCCVVDVSGSMGVECTNGDSESQGLSVLHVVKHACKTVVHSLTAQDRFTLVKYSTNAEVVLKLTTMNAAGVRMAELAIDQLTEDGQTNLWDGLHEGLKSLEDSSGRMKAVMILTDGQPNINPPRGIIPMFKKYKESNEMVCTVSTFGFGYNLDSKLLEELAMEGQGMYAFIPDGSFVGTAFVNATSNILSTAARQVTAKVSGLSDLAHITTPGVFNTKASWGLQVPLGAVMFGQSKDFIVSVPSELMESISSSVRVDVDYMTSGGLEKQMAFAEGIETVDDVEAFVQGIRVRTVDLLRSLKKDNELTAYTKRVADVSAQIKAAAVVSKEGDERVADIIKDLNGQVTEALSRNDWFTKWGRHYLPSLAIAHSLQQCHNFKDPGVQHYGGELFTSLRETAEAVFVKLPPPKVEAYVSPYAHLSAAPAAPVASRAPPVDMSAYYNRGGGCFTACTEVTMANGETKRIDQIQPGDVIQTFRNENNRVVVGTGVVKFVTEMQLSSPSLLVTLPGGLKLTAWHPVCVASGDDGAAHWVFPATIAAQIEQLKLSPIARYHLLDEVSSVFNLALEEGQCGEKWHGALLNGVPTIALGHGIEGDEVASHPYYGTDVVIKEMEVLERDSFGRVMVPPMPTEETDMLSNSSALVETSFALPVNV